MDSTAAAEPCHQNHHRHALGTSMAAPLKTMMAIVTSAETTTGTEEVHPSSINVHRDARFPATPSKLHRQHRQRPNMLRIERQLIAEGGAEHPSLPP
jgi:hypothetical protein